MMRQLEPDELREMKAEYSAKLEKLKAKISATNHDKLEFNGVLTRRVNSLIKPEYVCEIGDIEKKREVISSVYTEKMTFDRFSVRTNRINGLARLKYSMAVSYRENKNGQLETIPACPVKSKKVIP